jgi:DNA-binding NtrC family response regulator
LSQVIGFAKQSEGEICVESVRGKGTVFTLYLPRIRPAADDQAGATPLEAVAGGGARVLVVEDNENVGAFAAAALKELGFDSVLALDAGQALRQLETDSDTFDVVFSDVVIPGTSGLELAKIVQTRYPGIPVILASGYSHVLAESGSHGFPLLQKPYSLEELSRIIGAALASRGPASAGSPPGAGAQRSRRSSGGVHFRGDA